MATYWRLLCVIWLTPLAAATIDLPTRTAAQNTVPQQPPTMQALLVINHFLSSVAASNPSQAYYGFTSREFQDNVKFDEFKNFLQRFASLSRNRSVKHLKEEYYDKNAVDAAYPGDIVVVESVVESFDGQQNTANFVLIFEAGQWRLRSIEMLPAPLRER